MYFGGQPYRGGSTGGRSPQLAANFLNPVREFSVTFCLLSKAHIEISRFAPSIRLSRTYTEFNMSAYCHTPAFLARIYLCYNESFNLFLATPGGSLQFRISSAGMGKKSNLPLSLDVKKLKRLSASRRFCPPDQGLCAWTPLGALPPDPCYRLALRACHVALPK